MWCKNSIEHGAGSMEGIPSPLAGEGWGEYQGLPGIEDSIERA